MQVQAVAHSWALQATLLENAKAERERAESLSLALMQQAERREATEAAVLSAESNSVAANCCIWAGARAPTKPFGPW
ncbi:hypothetical protein [Hydrogenophaga palleronii]|uniref:hypothetical protein n=1 Tax=Hydrogenophaga palleronii TaxID=65655 RepID=UPI000AA0A62E|nr:hypothetical protein [Hydrogenophaga palleronii]